MSSFAATTAASYDDVAPADLETRAAALVNPASGLANDYLNVFNELVMLIEQLPAMPDLIDDVLQWRPVSYEAYFAASALPGRFQALESYRRMDAATRADFHALIDELDRCCVGCIAAIRLHQHADRDVDAVANLCETAGAAIRGILRGAAQLVDHGVSRAAEGAQSRADRLLSDPARSSQG